MQLLQQRVHRPLAFVEGARDEAQGLGDRPDRNEGLQSIGVANDCGAVRAIAKAMKYFRTRITQVYRQGQQPLATSPGKQGLQASQRPRMSWPEIGHPRQSGSHCAKIVSVVTQQGFEEAGTRRRNRSRKQVRSIQADSSLVGAAKPKALSASEYAQANVVARRHY